MAENRNQEKNGGQQDTSQLLKVRYDKLRELQENGKDPFVITRYDVTNHTADIRDHFEEMEGKEVAVAGRMMFKRVMGKASFCNIQDLKGRIQSYVARDDIGEESYKEFKKYDVGDILGIRGTVFKTKTGEISIHAAEVTLLCKSLQILPEKFHGLTDTDTRYRQRYVDLIMNEGVKETFVKRSRVISSIRSYLDAQGFMEVETPMLVSNAGGAAARPFETHFNALDEDFKLRISIELYLKRLIVGGLERVYEIGRVFRNEGIDTRHNPEFTLMELYQAYTDYHGMMDLTENLYRYVAKQVTGSEILTYGEHTMDLSVPFERITMVDAVKKYANVDFNEIHTTEEAKKLADEHHIEYEERHKKGDILSLFFEEYVEKHLIQPTFVMDHPVEISPLTKKKPDNPPPLRQSEWCVLVTTYEQLMIANTFSKLYRIYVEADLLLHAENALLPEQEYILVLPHILRKRSYSCLPKYEALLHNGHFKGVMVRNLEELEWLHTIGYQGPIYSDYTVYAWNQAALDFLESQTEGVTLPLELNRKELDRLIPAGDTCFVLYSYIPLMYSANCIRNTLERCIKDTGTANNRYHLTDRYRNDITIVQNCTHCYNILYNTVPMSLHGQLDRILKKNYPVLRLDFSVENGTQTRAVIEYFLNSCTEFPYKEFTNGHYKRGVE